MNGEFIVFSLLALVAVMGGILLINLNRVMHMMVALTFTFISIAGIYIMLSAEFVAIVQILIYAGSVTIIMIFGIMLTNHKDFQERKDVWWKRFAAFVGILAFAGAMYFGIYDLDNTGADTQLHIDNTQKIGIQLYSKYIIPFELTSAILLVALIGAIVLAKKDDEEGEEQ